MNWNIPFTTDRTERAPTIAAFLALAAILGVAGIAVFGGAAAAEEVANDTVEVTNETGEIYVSATFNGTIDDANATADVVIEDANGTEIANTSISGNASEVVTEEWAINDSDPTGNYSVIATEEGAGVVDSTDLGTFAASTGGGGGGSAGDADGWGSYMGYPIWMLALVVVAAVLIGHNREWWDLSEVRP